MARARNIKPGFFRNADLVELPVYSRLLFIGLWTLADREGRLEDRPKQIKMEIFPADSVDCDAMLDELASTGMIQRYTVGGKRYAQVVNFTKHQMPHHKEVPSDIPAPPGCAQVTRHSYDVPAKVREEVFARDGNACLKCGALDILSLDHIHPLASGGDNSINNLQTLCTSCNSSKGNTIKDYRKGCVDSTLSQRKPIQGVSCPSDSLLLIPDTLIPDTLIPDTLIPEVIPSVAKATGGKPPLVTDPNEIIFGYGLPMLTTAGTPEKQARSFLGGLRKHHGDDALIDKLRECARAKPLQPLEWLAGALPPDGPKPKKQTYTEFMVSAVGELTGKNTIESEAANVFAISRS